MRSLVHFGFNFEVGERFRSNFILLQYVNAVLKVAIMNANKSSNPLQYIKISLETNSKRKYTDTWRLKNIILNVLRKSGRKFLNS